MPDCVEKRAKVGMNGVLEICYFPLVSGDLKSFDIRTIYAIPGEFSEVLTMARYLSFSY